MKLSLILPVYNAAGTLPALLDSVLSQKTRAEWEFLAMDDGSDDPGPGILSEAAKKDPRLRVFSLSRGGPAAARQAGLKRASGDWILFADADDVFLPGAFLAVEEALAEKPDLLFFGYELSDGQLLPGTPYLPGAFAGGREGLAARLSDLYGKNQLNQVWGKAFSRRLLEENDVAFPDLYFGEDRLFLYGAVTAGKTFSCLDRPLYRYVAGKGTLVSRFLPEKPGICVRLEEGARRLFSDFGALDEGAARLLDYMFVKSILSCLVTLYSPGCPLKYREKRAWVKGIFALPALEKERRFPPDCGRAFRILAWVLGLKNVTLALWAARAVALAARLSPGAFRRAKHVYNQSANKTPE